MLPTRGRLRVDALQLAPCSCHLRLLLLLWRLLGKDCLRHDSLWHGVSRLLHQFMHRAGIRMPYGSTLLRDASRVLFRQAREHFL